MIYNPGAEARPTISTAAEKAMQAICAQLHEWILLLMYKVRLH